MFSSLDRIRLMAEACSSLQGLIYFLSLGGGTGSGLGSLILEGLSVDFDRKSKIGVVVAPSPKVCAPIKLNYIFYP